MKIFAMAATAAGLLAVLQLAPALRAETGAAENALKDAADIRTAIFAGGCFWCMESDFEKVDGVGDVVSGYAGGESQNPTYRDHEGHLEVVRVPYDPSTVSYRELVDYFFRHVDPLDDGGQFCDRGYSYTTAVFYQNAEEFAEATAVKAAAEAELGEPVVTPIRELDRFWVAEDYHQDYYKKNPLRYKFYRTSCGRDRRVREVWGG